MIVTHEDADWICKGSQPVLVSYEESRLRPMWGSNHDPEVARQTPYQLGHR